MNRTYRRRLLNALLSAVVPGAGQLAAGRLVRGLTMVGIAAAASLAAAVFFATGVDRALAWMVEAPVLLALLGLDIVLLAFRLFATADAYRMPPSRDEAAWRQAGRPTPSPQTPRSSPSVGLRRVGSSKRGASLAGVTLALLLLLVAAPHAVAGYYVYLSHDLITSVFTAEPPAPSTTFDAPTPVTAAPWPVVPSSTTSVTPTLPATTVPASTTTTTEAPPEWGSDERLTVLLIGTDAGYGRRGARADSIMVATIDLRDGYVALFGIPRNTGDLPLTGDAAQALDTVLYAGMISDLYEEALGHPELAPGGGNPGAVVLRDTVSTLLGIPIHHYAVVDMGGFVDLVDAFGGIKINVKERVWVRLSPPRPGEDYRVYDIRPGVQELDGHEALAFARSRTGSNDYERMRRQRCVIMALLHQNGVAELALRFPAVVEVIRNDLQTDIPLDRLQDLIRIRGRLKTGRVYTEGFGPPEYIDGRNELGYNILDTELVQATVRAFVEDPETVLENQAAEATGEDPSDCWRVD
jgi:LCP family protein required for cell wall assembly